MKKFYYTILTIIGIISGGVVIATAIDYMRMQNELNSIPTSGHGLEGLVRCIQGINQASTLKNNMNDCRIVLIIAIVALVGVIMISLVNYIYDKYIEE